MSVRDQKKKKKHESKFTEIVPDSAHCCDERAMLSETMELSRWTLGLRANEGAKCSPSPPTPTTHTMNATSAISARSEALEGMRTKNRFALLKRRLVCTSVTGKGHPAWLCPATDGCQDVDEVRSEQSSDAVSHLFKRRVRNVRKMLRRSKRRKTRRTMS